MALNDYIKSIQTGIKRREAKIPQLQKQIENIKERNKKMLVRAKELQKELDGKQKPTKATKPKPKPKPKAKAKEKVVKPLKLIIKKPAE